MSQEGALRNGLRFTCGRLARRETNLTFLVMRRLPLGSASQTVPAATGIKDRNPNLLGYGEEASVTGDQKVCPGSDGRGQNPPVGRIPHLNRGRLGWSRNHGLGP